MPKNQIIGTSSNDFLTDSVSDDDILALDGDDLIEVSSGNDLVDGGDGNDELAIDYSQNGEELQIVLNSYFDGFSNNGSIDIYFSSTGNNNNISFNNIERFAVRSGSGNDRIELGYNSFSDDWIDAGAGDDFISAGLGNDTIDGGGGFDILHLDYYFSPNGITSSLIDGNSGQYSDGFGIVNFTNIEALNVMGSNYSDVLVALSSNNFNSAMNYSPMNQMIDGGEGKDRLVADYSSRSEDLQFNLQSNNNYNGFNYPSLDGSVEVNSYNYGNYNSRIDFTNIESFSLTSGSGNDQIELGYDNYSDDEVNAGAGDDFIYAGLGNDTIDGGSGFDVLRLDFGFIESGITSSLDGAGKGEYSDGYSTIEFDNIEAINVIGSNYNDVLVAIDSNSFNPAINPYPMNQMIDGGEGKDRLVADYSSRKQDLAFNLQSNADYSNFNYPSLSGSININDYSYGNYNSQIDFNSIESFTLTSGRGNDQIELGYDNYSDDEVNAGAGNDFIYAGLGNDTIDGGSGFDVLRIDYSLLPSEANVVSEITSNGGGKYDDGFGTIKFSNIEAIDVLGSSNDDVLVALTGNNNLNAPVPYLIESQIDGGEGNDELVADYSQRSEDLMFNFSNSGSYFDGYNNYSISGSIDVSPYNYDNYNSRINFSNMESFRFTSGRGNDQIELGYDNFSDDWIDAGAGDDFINAGLGNDTIDGGTGFDVLRLDFANTNGVTSSLSDRNSGQYSDGISTVEFDNIEAVNVIGSNYNDVLVAVNSNNFNPSMNPYPMNQMIDGGEGEDRLIADYSIHSEDLMFDLNSYGDSGSIDVNSYMNGNYYSHIDFNSIEVFEIHTGNGNDRISLGYDNFSNDLIDAGAGNDFINASFGDDTIEGGKGNDTFFYERGHGVDVISDLSGNNDTIAFGATISLDNLSLDFEDNNLIVDVIDSPGDRIIVKDYTITGNSIENIDVGGQIFSIDEMIAMNADPEPEVGTIGEFGKVNNLNHNSQTIQLGHNFENPVVFALPLSRKSGDPSIVRITDIQSDSFTAYVQEAEYRDGIHPLESFSYMVLEAGTWELENGALLEVGTVDTSKTTKKGWENINFAADFGNKPVILSQVQTNLDDEFVRTRQKLASVDGFSLSLEEEEALRHSGHGQETVGWLAMDAGVGDLGGLQYQAGHTGRRVSHRQAKINFSQEFTTVPSLFASVASFYGGDASGLRYLDLNSTQARIMVEEDRSRDNEIGHTKENVDFLAIAGSGDLTAIAYEADIFS